MNAHANFDRTPARSHKRGLVASLKLGVLNWLLDGTHLGDVRFGTHSVTIGDRITMDTQVPTAAGQLGMDAVGGRPRAFIGGAARDLLGAHEVIKTDGTNPLSADWPLGSKKLTGLTDGSVGSQDACSVKQMEDKVLATQQALFWLDDVDAFAKRSTLPAYAAAANTLTATANAAFPAQDGVAAVANQRYLVADDAGGSHLDHGVYKLTTLGSGTVAWVLTREPEMASGDSAASRIVGVDQGTLYGDVTWRCKSNAGADLVGTNVLVFDLFGKTVDHGSLVGNGDDDHAQYALLAGRGGGQIQKGGVNASENLTLQSTNHATKGKIIVSAGDIVELAGDDSILPAVTGQGRLGSAAKKLLEVRALNVYTGDLHLQNPNDPEANWTLVERRTGITMRNNTTGVEYDMVLSRRGLMSKLREMVG